MDVATATIPAAADTAFPLPRETARVPLRCAFGSYTLQATQPRPTLLPLTRDLLNVTSAHPRPGWSRLALLSLRPRACAAGVPGMFRAPGWFALVRGVA
jgi:hypothetical protein